MSEATDMRSNTETKGTVRKKRPTVFCFIDLFCACTGRSVYLLILGNLLTWRLKYCNQGQSSDIQASTLLKKWLNFFLDILCYI